MGIIPEDANSPLQEAGGRGEGAAADQAPTGQAMQKLEKRLGRRPPLGERGQPSTCVPVPQDNVITRQADFPRKQGSSHMNFTSVT